MNNTELMDGCTLAPYWWDDVPRPHLPNQPLPPTIDITVRNGAVVVTFTGILEQASTLSPHSFAPVAGATSPYSLPLPLPGGLFFRATHP